MCVRQCVFVGRSAGGAGCGLADGSLHRCAWRRSLRTGIVAVGVQQFVDKGLVAVGRMPANQRDKFGETFGSGSGMSVDRSSWRRTATGYEGDFVLLPDRGYNVDGTTNYRPRLNKLAIALTPACRRWVAAGRHGGRPASRRRWSTRCCSPTPPVRR